MRSYFFSCVLGVAMGLKGVLFAATALGSTISITTADGDGADSWVQQGIIHGVGPDDNFGDHPRVLVKDGSDPVIVRKGYLRFDISTLASSVADATLSLQVSTNNTNDHSPANELLYSVYALSDGAIETWDEGVITWNNAPANLPANNLSSDATLLGQIEVPAVDPTTNTVIVDFSNQALVDFVNDEINDVGIENDGLVTLILRRETFSDAFNTGFWSKENTVGGLAPTLSLVEQAPGDGNGDGWVDGLDYLLWAGNFATHPGPDGDISDGDYNDDGWVDGLDYLLWAGNFGTHATTRVPEPGTLCLALLGLVGLFGSTRRGRR